MGWRRLKSGSLQGRGGVPAGPYPVWRTSGGTGDAPGTVGLRLEFPTWPNLDEDDESDDDETPVGPLLGSAPKAWAASPRSVFNHGSLFSSSSYGIRVD